MPKHIYDRDGKKKIGEILSDEEHRRKQSSGGAGAVGCLALLAVIGIASILNSEDKPLVCTMNNMIRSISWFIGSLTH